MTSEELIAQLGFNTLEAEVYVALLKHGPQTAYKIGKLLNRPTANVYKAVDVLANSGAIELEEGDVRVCRAIPVKALALQLQRNYKQKLDQAVAELSVIKPETTDEGIFKLQTTESVFQRAKEMLKRCSQIAIIDAFPKTLETLKSDINKLPKRGVEVLLEAYGPVSFDKQVKVTIPAISLQSLNYWKAQQLNITIDGKEMLVALFNDDLTELIHATYSNNLYLSCLMHNGLMNEHKVHQFINAKTAKEIEELKKHQRFLYNSKVPGLKLLFELYREEK